LINAGIKVNGGKKECLLRPGVKKEIESERLKKTAQRKLSNSGPSI